MGYCAQCGASVDGRFCRQCGAPAPVSPPPPQPPANDPPGWLPAVGAFVAVLVLAASVWLGIRLASGNGGDERADTPPTQISAPGPSGSAPVPSESGTAAPPPTDTSGETPTGDPAPTTAQAPTTAPAPTVSAGQQLSDQVTSDLSTVSIDGHWVAQISSKRLGSVDPTIQPGPFSYDDIWAEHQTFRTQPYGSMVRLLRQGDFGKTPAKPPTVWITIADLNAGSKAAVESWCSANFSPPPGKDMDWVCRPRQLTPPP